MIQNIIFIIFFRMIDLLKKPYLFFINYACSSCIIKNSTTLINTYLKAIFKVCIQKIILINSGISGIAAVN